MEKFFIYEKFVNYIRMIISVSINLLDISLEKTSIKRELVEIFNNEVLKKLVKSD